MRSEWGVNGSLQSEREIAFALKSNPMASRNDTCSLALKKKVESSAPSWRAGEMFIEWLNCDGADAQSLINLRDLSWFQSSHGGGLNATASHDRFVHGRSFRVGDQCTETRLCR
jgi:hypothetical protein